ncbi:MAG: hypothetical protein WDA22_17175 [Bacteroidota bacterium]
MKLNIILISIIPLSLFIISCESPVPSKHNIVNEPPVITITGIDSSMLFGDTLKLTLHVSDATLKNGSVDFGDSNIVVFSIKESVIDTTLFHYYKSQSFYGISASFNDGENTSTKNIRVMVLNFFTPTLTLVPNKSTLNLFEDTLRITLHADDFSLSNGFLDFKDGTIMTFPHLSHVLDTTVEHIYSHSGAYSVAASFGDGEKVTTKNLDVTVSDPPPIVTITTDTTSLSYGDTLKIKLHAYDRTLFSGSVDFTDGTILIFSNLNRVLDTTIYHVYSHLGMYHVSSIFSDGIRSTTTSALITINPRTQKRYYELLLPIGTSWQFSYSKLGRNDLSLEYSKQWGIHEWKILKSSIVNQDTVLTVRQIMNDSVRTSEFIGIGYSHKYYAVNETSQFTIITSSNVIHFNAPVVGGSISVPNRTYVISYPIKIEKYSDYMIFEDEHGPTEYHYSWGYAPAKSSIQENLKLILFKKP